MRDLAKSIGNARVDSKKRSIKVILIAVALVAIIFFINNLFFGNNVGGRSVILKDAPFGMVPVGVSAQSTTVQGGVNLSTQQATFKDVKGDGGTATATRSFGGGTYILNVDANLPDPKNTNYQVWLVGSSGEVVPVDFMSGSKTSWSLSIKDTDKFSKYKGIWITLERTKDSLPEEHILEGTF